ncbi:hypothetical protein ACLB2K_070935 [Fragaria x ananassa]
MSSWNESTHFCMWHGVTCTRRHLQRVTKLNLTSLKLSGSISPHIGNLSFLRELLLYNNSLTNIIPPEIGHLQRLQRLSLGNNSLSGTIPANISNCFNLRILSVYTNVLGGDIPPQLGSLSKLEYLNLEVNNLTGEIPPSLGNLPSLETLSVRFNLLVGSIPSELGSLSKLEYLGLRANILTGGIPPSLGNLSGLHTLDVGYNMLVVPVKGVFNNASAISVVGNTRLCGGISDLHLPKCKFKESRWSRSKKLTISLVSAFTVLGVAMLLMFLFLCFLKKRSKETPSSTLANSVLQVSYSALLKATDGFSASNLIGAGSFGSVYKGILGEDGEQLVAVKALVYKHMENGSLEEWLHPTTETEDTPKSLSLVQRLDITIDVACAVDYLHNHCETPIVHCDLKPSNVLLDHDLTGHVADFGLARILSRLADNVSANQSSSIGIRGTVGYVAAEYGMGSEVSTYGDIYSFGILLLEIFIGKRPTDHIFMNGLNLRKCVKMAIGERISEIEDSSLLQKVDPKQSTNDAVEECIRWDPQPESESQGDESDSWKRKRKSRWAAEEPKPVVQLPDFMGGIEFDPEIQALNSRLRFLSRTLITSLRRITGRRSFTRSFTRFQ